MPAATANEAAPDSSAKPSQWVTIPWCRRSVRIEYRWVGEERCGRPLIVFLHEALGSVAMWKSFPEQLCGALGARGLLYSRPGNGRSTPHAALPRRTIDYLHRQAQELLPALLAALDVQLARGPVCLFGHSDGASIGLLHAALSGSTVHGVIALAPHYFVEPSALSAIAATRDAYRDTDLRERLGRYHDDVDATFRAWLDIWLDPAFCRWNIADDIARIACPVLCIQGADDEYGTLEQVHGIARRLPSARVVELSDCGHSPHKDQPDRVIAEVSAWMKSHAMVPPRGGDRHFDEPFDARD